MTDQVLYRGNWGIVTSYDSHVGEGVVTSERTGGEMLLRAHRLRAAGLDTIAVGARIRYSVKVKGSGPHVDKIFEIDGVPTHFNEPPILSVRAKPITIEGRTWIQARVAGFATSGKFAFLSSDGIPQIFVGDDILDDPNTLPLNEGELVEVECGLTPKGIQAIRIRSCS